MKKLMTLFFTMTFALSVSVFAQTVSPTVTIGQVSGSSPVDVPITFDIPGTVTITAFDLEIEYPTGISFVNEVEVDGLLIGGSQWAVTHNSTARTVSIGWAENGTSLTDANNGDLLKLRFSGPAGGPHSLTFTSSNDLNNEFLDDGDVQVASEFVDGSVEFIASVPFKNWAIYIGFGLIFAFVIVRFRRLF